MNRRKHNTDDKGDRRSLHLVMGVFSVGLIQINIRNRKKRNKLSHLYL